MTEAAGERSPTGGVPIVPRKSRSLGAFVHVSLDGYYCDPRGDMSFAHKPPDDAEWNEFVTTNASSGGMLLFGRKTYDMMAAWWPTEPAARAMPEVAASMNAMPKIVFSLANGATRVWSRRRLRAIRGM